MEQRGGVSHPLPLSLLSWSQLLALPSRGILLSHPRVAVEPLTHGGQAGKGSRMQASSPKATDCPPVFSLPPPGTHSLIKNPAERADLKMLMVSNTHRFWTSRGPWQALLALSEHLSWL